MILNKKKYFFVLLFFLLFLISPFYARAADITSAQDGNWSSGSTWTGGMVPGDGDTVTITHNVTASADVTVGTSPSDQTTFVLQTGTGGKLIINDGVTVTVKGNSYFNSATSKATWKMGLQIGTGATGGARFRMTSAGNPTQAYYFKQGLYTQVYARGISSNNSIFEMESGYAGGKMDSAGTTNNSWDADYLTIQNWNASGGFVVGASSTYMDQGVSFNHTVFLNNKEQRFLTWDTTAPITLNNITESGSSASSGLRWYLNGRTGHLANLTLNNSVINDQATFAPPTGWSITNTYLGGGILTSIISPETNPDQVFSAFHTNVIHGQNTNSEIDADNVYFINDLTQSNGGNIRAEVKSASHTIQNSIFDLAFGTAQTGTGTGDLLSPIGLAASPAYTLTVKNNILLPSINGCSPGKFVSFWNYVGNVTTVIENNTVNTCRYGASINETGVVGLGEFVAPCSDDASCGNRTGMVSSFRNNLAWSPSGLFACDTPGSYPQGGYKAVRWNSDLADMINVGNADYNWGWNTCAGNSGNGYNPYSDAVTEMFSSGTPDSHGGSSDPQFVDTTRNFARYDTDRLNNTATAWATATNYSVGDYVSSTDPTVYGGATVNYRCIKAHTSSVGDVTNGKPGIYGTTSWRTNWELATHQRIRENTTRIADLNTWVKAGYQPRNSALLSGYGGTYIGAVQPATDASKPVVTAFVVPANSNSLTVPITTFTATDNVGVSKYLLTESSSTPSVDDLNWQTSVQTEYVFATEGSKTLYAWAKDAAGNISENLSGNVTVTLPTYTVGGTVSGLSGTVVLQNNGANDLSLSASGFFMFTSALHTGESYNVTLLIQPANQICDITRNTGTIFESNVVNVSVNCENNLNLEVLISAVTVKSSSSNKKKIPNRYISNSRSTIKYGQVLMQRGKKFSKQSLILLYFSKPNGTYYAPQRIITNKKGDFSIKFLVKKPKGTYKWYAVDTKTGKKSRVRSYRVR